MSTIPPAAHRIPGYPHLVQRLTHHEPRGSEQNIGKYFDFDYMGSSEFEWGTIPKAKRALLAAMATDVFEPVKVMEGDNVAWYVGPAAHLEVVRVWFREELSTTYTGMQESSMLKDAYTAPDEHTPNGWFCVDSGWHSGDGRPVWGLFVKKDHARDFIKGLRG